MGGGQKQASLKVLKSGGGLEPRSLIVIGVYAYMRARRSTSFSARLVHSSRQICGRLKTPITVQLTTKFGASASLDKSAQDVDDLRQRLIDVWTGIQQPLT